MRLPGQRRSRKEPPTRIKKKVWRGKVKGGLRARRARCLAALGGGGNTKRWCAELGCEDRGGRTGGREWEKVRRRGWRPKKVNDSGESISATPDFHVNAWTEDGFCVATALVSLILPLFDKTGRTLGKRHNACRCPLHPGPLHNGRPLWRDKCLLNRVPQAQLCCSAGEPHRSVLTVNYSRTGKRSKKRG